MEVRDDQAAFPAISPDPRPPGRAGYSLPTSDSSSGLCAGHPLTPAADTYGHAVAYANTPASHVHPHTPATDAWPNFLLYPN